MFGALLTAAIVTVVGLIVFSVIDRYASMRSIRAYALIAARLKRSNSAAT